jgi:hypothetical protein
MIWTITLGSDLPFDQGGRGPDEPIWYFDVREQAAKAMQAVVDSELDFTAGTVDAVPEDDWMTDASEFGVYLMLQLGGDPGCA